MEPIGGDPLKDDYQSQVHNSSEALIATFDSNHFNGHTLFYLKPADSAFDIISESDRGDKKAFLRVMRRDGRGAENPFCCGYR